MFRIIDISQVYYHVIWYPGEDYTGLALDLRSLLIAPFSNDGVRIKKYIGPGSLHMLVRYCDSMRG